MQNRILCIHDLAGVGRCSLSVIIPVLNVLGHETCALPTAVLSCHTGGFGTPASQEMTLHCVNSLAHYESLGIVFDCVYSGYVASEAQLALTRTVLAQNENALFVLDPVMGDNRQMYKSLPNTLPHAMRECAAHAHILTPNETESALLLNIDPNIIINTQADAITRLQLLSELCSGDIVITGLSLENNQHCNAVHSKDKEVRFINYNHLGRAYPGTGDIFTAVVCGRYLKGDNIFTAVATASDFVADCVTQAELDWRSTEYGVPFEKLLGKLI